MEIIFHSHANKTHFHKKGCALRLILKEILKGFWNSEDVNSLFKNRKKIETLVGFEIFVICFGVACVAASPPSSQTIEITQAISLRLRKNDKR